MAKGRTIWKWVTNILWCAVGISTLVLLIAAMRQKDNRHCRRIDISIDGAVDNFFVDKKDILNVLSTVAGGNPVGQPAGNCNLLRMEAALKKNTWIKEAQLFFDNNDVLQVKVAEREPVARVFAKDGNSFYVDSSTVRLPLSDKFAARVPMFTGFPAVGNKLPLADSALLADIKTLGQCIRQDSFCMALIEQVDIDAQRGFEMVPKIGNTIIAFGNVSDAVAKLERLKLFYKQVMPKAGPNYYSRINLQYAGQVVAARRGAADITMDSLRTMELLKLLALRAEERAGDSAQTFLQDNPANTLDSNSVLQSVERDDEGGAPESGGQLPTNNTVTIPSATAPSPTVAAPAAAVAPSQPASASPKPAAPAARPSQPAARPQPVVQNPRPQPAATRTATPRATSPPKPPPKPRAVMPPKNDY
jgi:cell division protein FtsQ